jgi:hypothetical protein
MAGNLGAGNSENNCIFLFGRNRKKDRLLEIVFLKIFSLILLLQQDLAPPVAIMHNFATGPEIFKTFEKIISRNAF